MRLAHVERDTRHFVGCLAVLGVPGKDWQWRLYDWCAPRLFWMAERWLRCADPGPHVSGTQGVAVQLANWM
ncbi:MAG: hypothetical protein AAGK37_01040 [Pseudomonadota bacterium]